MSPQAAGAAPEVVVEDSTQDLAVNTATRTIAALAAALRERGVAHLAITGGTIIDAVLDELGTAASRDALDWGQVHIWWGDERYVPTDSDERNDREAFGTGLGSLALDPAKVHRMPAADAGFGDDVEAAADSYAAELAAAAHEHRAAVDATTGGTTTDATDDTTTDDTATDDTATDDTATDDTDRLAFDVVLLGVGPDGHCCSLFPEHPGLQQLDTSVIAVHNSPKPPPTRISLSFTGLNAAEEIWVVASGDGKAQAVAMALGGADRAQIPSAGARGQRRTLWLLDPQAAARLPTPPPQDTPR